MKDVEKKRRFALKLAVLMMVFCVLLTISAAVLAAEPPTSESVVPEAEMRLTLHETRTWQMPVSSWVVIVICSVVAAALLADSMVRGRRKKDIA